MTTSGYVSGLMMSISAIVKRKRKTRKGKGFSRDELREVGLSTTAALKLGVSIDTRRSTKHETNVKVLQAYTEALKRKPAGIEETAKIVELKDVKGIGPKTADKLIEAEINTANDLAVATPEEVAEAIGCSEERAANFIDDARTLLTER